MLKKLIHAITWRVKAWFLAASEILSDLIQNVIAGSMLCPRGLRIVLYRLAGNSVGKNCWLSPNCFLGPGGVVSRLVITYLSITTIGLI